MIGAGQLEQLKCPQCEKAVPFLILRVVGESEDDRMVIACAECKQHFEMHPGDPTLIYAEVEWGH